MSTSDEPLIAKTITSEIGRDFLLQLMFFSNGSFVIVSEGDPRIGALSISMSASNKVNTAKVIPSKYDSVFINTVAEKISSITNSICLVSLYTKNQLQLEDMKAIMGELMSIIGARAQHEKSGGPGGP